MVPSLFFDGMTGTHKRQQTREGSKVKILVTGAAGFLGRHLVQLLQQKKHQIVTIVRPTSDTAFLKERKVEMLVGDLHDPDCIAKATTGVDVIVHAAATLRGSYETFQAINVDSTRLLLEAGVKNKVKRFVFISSVIVYDHTQAGAGTCFDESLPYEEVERTYYCETKIAAEKLVTSYHTEKGLKSVILRPAAIFGKSGPLFLSRLGFAAGGSRYLIIGDGKMKLPLSHVEGVADAVNLAIQKRAAIGQTYNVVEDEGMRQIDFFEEVRRYVNPKFKAIKVPFGVMKALSMTADKLLGLVGMTSPLPLSYMRLCNVPFSYSNEKIKKQLGWQPRADFRESIRDMMLWHRQKLIPKRNWVDESARVEIYSTRGLRVGVVGCGIISGPHLDALQRLTNAEVVALCDPVEDARRTMAEKYGVKATYSGYKEMLASEQLDVVHVCTPAQNHAEVSIAAMKKGCHVFVEKPMAQTAVEAKRMLAASSKYRVKLCVDHNHLFDQVMIKTRRTIAAGTIGKVSYVEAWYGTSYSSDTKSRYLTYAGKNNWAYALPGSLYQNFISHPISLLFDVMEEADVRGVQAKFNRVVPHMSSDELRVTFENDQTLGMVHMSMAVSPRYLFMNIYGTAGTLRVDFLNKTLFVEKPNARLPRVISRSLTAMAYAATLTVGAVKNIASGVLGKYNMYQGNETLIRLFYKSILEDLPGPITAEEGLRSMQVMDEIWRRLKPGNGETMQPAQVAPATKNGVKKGSSSRRRLLQKGLPEKWHVPE